VARSSEAMIDSAWSWLIVIVIDGVFISLCACACACVLFGNPFWLHLTEGAGFVDYVGGNFFPWLE
jgi:hypothetical protein